MHSFTVNCDTFSNEEKVVVVVPVTCVEIACSQAMLGLIFSSSLFVYFVFDENSGKVSTRVNGWPYSRWMYF